MYQEGLSYPDWIAAGSSAVSAIAVVVGLVIAGRQLVIWQAQERQKARTSTAEKIMMSALSIRDLMDAVRHPLSSIPVDQLKNKYFDYDRRLKVLQDNVSFFAELRLAQFKAQILGFGSDVDTAITNVFRSRSEFQNAVRLLADYVDERPETEEERKLVRDARADVYARGDEKDLIGKKLKDSILILETQLGPIIRMNE